MVILGQHLLEHLILLAQIVATAFRGVLHRVALLLLLFRRTGVFLQSGGYLLRLLGQVVGAPVLAECLLNLLVVGMACPD